MPWSKVPIFFIMPASISEVQNQEHVLVTMEELAGITTF